MMVHIQIILKLTRYLNVVFLQWYEGYGSQHLFKCTKSSLAVPTLIKLTLNFFKHRQHFLSNSESNVGEILKQSVNVTMQRGVKCI